MRGVRYTQLTDAGWLRERYEVRGMSRREIAAELGCARQAVSYALARNGVQTRPAVRPPVVAVGERFGLLVVVALAPGLGDGRRLYLVRCDCGEEVVARGDLMRRGSVQSCGCLLKGRHKHTSRNGGVSPTYGSWRAMLSRCRRPGVAGYENYGGRGITVCKRWERFENFLADMGERPEGKTIDRIDNDGHYEPGNCRWATRKEQAQNRR